MQELLKRIVQKLVDNPEQIKITAVEGKQVVILELKVAKEDIGKIIGKQGHTAHAIRTILGAASAKIKKRATLEIIE
ncbi:MAG: KH domain-containing protein [Desulfobacterales bacterium]